MRKYVVIFLILLIGLIPLGISYMENASLVGNTAALPERKLSVGEQQAQVAAGLIIKPAYMIASLAIILILIGQKRRQLVILQYGLVAFLAGEIFCAINFYMYRHESILAEYIHSYGMVLAFGLIFYALLDGWASRFGKSEHSKLFQSAGLLFRFIAPAAAILTFIPLLTPLNADAYAVTLFGIPYSYTRFDFYLLYERRILPLIPLFAFIAAGIPYLKKGQKPLPPLSKLFFSVGFGTFGFAFFRVALNALFVDNLVWFEFWEEMTELIFIAAVGYVLWSFRNTLLDRTPMVQNISQLWASSD